MVLPAPVVPFSEVALIDAAAEALGCPVIGLMERAGEALAAEARKLAGEGPVLVVCGPGNNGGDGYVCARHLARAGVDTTLWAVEPPRSDLAQSMAERLPDTVRRVAGPEGHTGLVVDCILGAGSLGQPREPIADALRRLHAGGWPVLAADAPTGLGTDLVLPATLTLCFQVAKRELIGAPGVGEFKTVDIGIPADAVREVQPSCLTRFPHHRKDGHKGHHGELLVIGGGVFPGALEFAARAAVLSGCDLVRAWTAEGPPLPATIIAHRQDGDSLHPAADNELTPLLVRAGCILIGPGMGRRSGAAEAADQVFGMATDLGVPVVVDADGLALLNQQIRNHPADASPILVTPHRGEARNLVGSSDEEAVHAFARPNRVVLAKAPVDLVSDGQRWQRNHRGNPRMSMGGTGDVLAGLAAGLMARGVHPYDAARMAVLWVTESADELWQDQGPCYDTLDLLRHLPSTLKRLLVPLGIWPPV